MLCKSLWPVSKYTNTRISEKNACERLQTTQPFCSKSDNIAANRDIPGKSAHLGENLYKPTLFVVSFIETLVD